MPLAARNSFAYSAFSFRENIIFPNLDSFDRVVFVGDEFRKEGLEPDRDVHLPCTSPASALLCPSRTHSTCCTPLGTECPPTQLKVAWYFTSSSLDGPEERFRRSFGNHAGQSRVIESLPCGKHVREHQLRRVFDFIFGLQRRTRCRHQASRKSKSCLPAPASFQERGLHHSIFGPR